MGLTEITAANKTEAVRQALQLAGEARRAGKSAVILASDGRTVRYVRDCGAACGADFGVTVSTWRGWIEDNWVLFGDGRQLMADGLRQVYCLAALGCQDKVPVSAGNARVLDRLVGRYGRDSLRTSAGVSLCPAHEGVARALARYYELLEEQGLTESSCALFSLIDLGVFSRTAVVWLSGADPLPWQIRAAEALGAAGAEVSIVCNGCLRAPAAGAPGRAEEIAQLMAALPFTGKPTPKEPVARTGAVELALPAGPLAQPLLWRDTCVALVEEERRRAAAENRPFRPVLFVNDRPGEVFDTLGPVLSALGVGCTCTASVPFADTTVGAAFLCLTAFMFEPAPSKDLLSDFAYNPCSGLGFTRAREFDCWLRENRAVTVRAALDSLCAASETARAAVEALDAGDPKACIDALTARGGAGAAGGADPADRSAFYAAAEGLMAAACTGARLGLPYDRMKGIYEALGVSRGAGFGADVVMCTPAQAASRAPLSSSALMLTDLTAAAYPLPRTDGPETAFLEALGISPADAGLDATRAHLFSALEATVSRVWLERPLNGPDAVKAYSSLLLAELLDCYRPDPADTDSLDDRGFPLVFTDQSAFGAALSPGEDGLLDNPGLCADLASAAPVALKGIKLPAAEARWTAEPAEVLPRGSRTVFSASRIETYLACPYRWFVEARLRAGEFDAGFGPLEKGLFAHEVFKRFYNRLTECGLGRPTPENADECREILDQVAVEVLESMTETAVNWAFSDMLDRPWEAPQGLICQRSAEEHEVRLLLEALGQSLQVQAELYPGFRPLACEWEFGPGTDRPVEYAGVPMRGSVDRIDVDGNGHAVIWDYKGSLRKAFAWSSAAAFLPGVLEDPELRQMVGDAEEQPADLELPLKVQALIYAQIVRRVTGLRPVAALYLSYKRQPRQNDRLAGAYAAPFAPPEAYLVARVSSRCESEEDFCNLLDRVERRIRVALEYLAAGHFPPEARAPLNAAGVPDRNETPCRYCECISCPHWSEVSHESFDA